MTQSPLIPRATPLRVNNTHNTHSPVVAKGAKTPLVAVPMAAVQDENACIVDGIASSAVVVMMDLATMDIDASVVVGSTHATPVKSTPLRV